MDVRDMMDVKDMMNDLGMDVMDMKYVTYAMVLLVPLHGTDYTLILYVQHWKVLLLNHLRKNVDPNFQTDVILI